MRLRLAWSLVLVLVLALSIATAHADINVDSGYITYNTTTQSTFFYYFVESTKTNAPLTLWLQGGPGASSLMGAFTENGPYQYDGDTNTVSENPYSWHQESHMLYLDQPVGTGFSYTEDNSSYPTTLEEVSENVYTFLQLFFEQQPSLVGLDFYIAGESFQGHYGPALASHIMSKNQQLAAQRSIKTAVSIPLQGLFMGDPWIHPYEQTPAYAEYAYATGLIDQCGRNTARGMVEAFQSAVKNENWGLAGNLSDGIQEFVLSSAGHVDIDDIRQGSMIPYIELLMQLGNYLDLPAIQKELNVRQNSTWNSLCEFCSEPLELTVVQSTLPLVASCSKHRFA